MNTSKSGKTSVAAELLHFYDEFVEFHDHCSFLCDAFVCLASEEDCLEASTVMGVSRYSQWLKRRARELKEELRQIQKRSHTEKGLVKS